MQWGLLTRGTAPPHLGPAADARTALTPYCSPRSWLLSSSGVWTPRANGLTRPPKAGPRSQTRGPEGGRGQARLPGSPATGQTQSAERTALGDVASLQLSLSQPTLGRTLFCY